MVSINRLLASKQDCEHMVFKGRLLHLFLWSNKSNINQTPFCSGAPDYDDNQALCRWGVNTQTGQQTTKTCCGQTLQKSDLWPVLIWRVVTAKPSQDNTNQHRTQIATTRHRSLVQRGGHLKSSFFSLSPRGKAQHIIHSLSATQFYKKGSEFMRRSMRLEVPSMPTAAYDPRLLREQETPPEIGRD